MLGEPAEEMVPKLDAPTVFAGLLNCGVLKRLKNSPRICRLLASLKWKFLKTEKSTSLVSGPYRMFRPELPQIPAGLAKAAVLNHS